MTINDILKLDYSKENIKQIDKFLNHTDKLTFTYLEAICHKYKLLSEIKLNNSLREIYQYVSNFNTMTDEEVVLICDTIMYLTLKANRLDEYEKYMLIKADRIKIRDNYSIYYDKYKYYLALKNYSEAIIQIKNYLANDLNTEKRYNALFELLELSFNLKNTDLFFETYDEISLLNSYDDYNEQAINYFVIEINNYLNNYDLAYELGKKYLANKNIDDIYKLKVSTIILNILIIKKEYRQAAIFESDYTNLCIKENENAALDYAKTALKLYQSTNHKISITYYEDKIKEINEYLNKERKKKKEIYIIPEVIEEKEDDRPTIVAIKPKEKKEIVKEYLISENNTIINNLINIISKNQRLRDVLREIGIVLDRFNIIKFNLVYKVNSSYFLHTYKNQKLYDRTYLELPESFIKYAYLKGESLFLDEELLKNERDIFTNDLYNNKFVASFPLENNLTKFGSIEFIADSDFLTIDNNYELFLNIVKLISLRISLEIDYKNKKEELALEHYVWQNFYFSTKKIINDLVYLDGNATRLLNLDSEVSLTTFMSYIDSNYFNSYKEILNEVKSSFKNNLKISYYYNKDNIKKYLTEIFYIYKIDEDIIIFSIISDDTNFIKEKEEITNKSFINETSGFNNLNKLIYDMNHNKEKRYSLAVFGINDLNKYLDLYGMLFYNSFIKSLYNNTKIFFKDYYNVNYYQIHDEYFVLMIFNIKDKRKVETLLNKFVKYLNGAFIDLKYSVHPLFSVGIYNHIKEDNKDNMEMINFAYNAYLDSLDSNQICYYSYKNYKNRFKEKEKLMLLQEQILNNQIKIAYVELIDILNSCIFGYVIKLTLPNLNIYEDEILELLYKHNKLNLYQKYKLRALCQDLKRLYDEVGAYIEVFVEFDSRAIDENFSDFVLTQLNFFKLPANVLTLIVPSYSPNLDLLIKNNIKIITRDLFDILNHKLNNIYLDLNKLNINYLKEINEVINSLNANIYLGNVDNKNELIDIKEANISYIYGKVYSKAFNINELVDELKED